MFIRSKRNHLINKEYVKWNDCDLQLKMRTVMLIVDDSCVNLKIVLVRFECESLLVDFECSLECFCCFSCLCGQLFSGCCDLEFLFFLFYESKEAEVVYFSQRFSYVDLLF